MKTSIYGLCDPRSGELRYIGKTSKDPNKRLTRHASDARLGQSGHKNNWIRVLLALGLVPEIFIIEDVDGNGADEEVYHIAQFRAMGCNLTNATEGGEGKPGWVPSPENLERMRAAQQAAKKANPVSPETRERLRLSHLGKVRSPKARAKFADTIKRRTPEERAAVAARMSVAKRGHKTSEETKEKIRIGNLGKEKSPETRARMAASAIGRKMSPEARAKMKASSYARYARERAARHLPVRINLLAPTANEECRR